MTRTEAEIKLKKRFGIEKFYDSQWNVIEKLLSGKRILFIEKTGYGKSLCFQFASTELDGVTIVFSPLIALMRDQVRSMGSKGIRTAAINSNQTFEENEQVIEKAKRNELDIVYIAPERLENADWISSAIDMKIAMVVIDEAHCISMWGHSFRPNYRRIVKLVRLLPENFPVLATTATATLRVQEDIMTQIGTDIELIRGRLLRSNLRLFVVKVESEEEKFYWLARYLPKMRKAGIIYTGTRAGTEVYSNWIQYLGLDSAFYSGRLDSETRKRIEDSFIKNDYYCVVSTNALGMGIDKPDIRFIIHTQIPQSPINYYQEIGRAGRDGNISYGILLYNPNTDKDLPMNFINGSKPEKKNYEKVIAAVKKELLSKREIMKKTNLKETEVSVILADLIDQGIINEIADRTKKYFFNPNSPELDMSSFDNLRQIQLQELDKILEYTDLKTCRMKYLCEYLGDDNQKECGTCDNCKRENLSARPTEEVIEKFKTFKEQYFPILEVESQRSAIVNGVASSLYGFSNVGAAIHHSKYESGGDYPDWLLILTLKAFRKHFGSKKFDMIVYVPSTESGSLVRNFAQKISDTLKIPISHKLAKSEKTKPQKVFRNNISKKDNVKDKFIYQNVPEVIGKKILLIDDIFDSGHTIKEIGRYLTTCGAEEIAPLVIAKTVGGDIKDD